MVLLFQMKSKPRGLGMARQHFSINCIFILLIVFSLTYIYMHIHCTPTFTNLIQSRKIPPSWLMGNNKKITIGLESATGKGLGDTLKPENHRMYGNNTNLGFMMQTLTREKTQATDPRVIMVLRNYMLDPPSKKTRKLSYPLFKTPQAEVVEKIMKNKERGFFVECGALDGERSSNTIYLEHKRDWSGLLVEVDPSWYQQLRGKNRRCYSINACMSPHNFPMIMEFKEHFGGGGKMVEDATESSSIQQVYCFPLYSMLLALNRTHVDYFSLDVEGLELDVLRAIPFERIDISVLTVEYVHVKGGISELKKFMQSKGYITHSKISVTKEVISLYVKDLVFVKQGLTYP